MKRFSDFNIKPSHGRFIGEKIKMYNVLNREIIVHDFKVNDSKFKESNSKECLYLQIEIEGAKRVLFTGSKVLVSMIKNVPKENIPFKTTIIKEGETFQFS